MKFLTFLASTMLIVLISQQSTMGLPVDTESTTVADDRHDKVKDTSDASTPSDSTVTVTRPQETTVTYPARHDRGCPEGQKLGEHGCEDVKTSETTTLKTETSEVTTLNTETTTLNVETTSGGMNYMDCPGGLKRGDDGFCPEFNKINRSESVNPKDVLKSDGACPDNYEKFNGKCLYIKPKSDGSSAGDISNRVTPSTEETNNSELVPVEVGNLCPKGTEYYTNGLCRRLPTPSKDQFDESGRRVCPADYESIDGNCIHKGVKDDSTSTSQQEMTTLLSESANHRETTESISNTGTDGRDETTLTPKSLRI